MAAVRPWFRDRVNQLRESSCQPVTSREYHLLVAMIAFAVLGAVIAVIT
jgi:hypothetical protein